MKLKNTYQNLTKDLLQIHQAGQIKALGQLQKTRTETYWQMGERLYQAPEIKAQKKIPAEWATRLSEDLQLSSSVLYRILQFYLAYPKGLPKALGDSSLSWRSHVALLPLQDPAERAYYLKKAIDQSWSEKQLRSALKQKLYQSSLLPEGSKQKKGKAKLTRPTSGLYLYKAVVERVIDGDTLLVLVDLGFDVWKKQRLRLRAIDCAELKTPEGQAATNFVKQYLNSVEFVIVKTYKVDLHGRFVCDVFFQPGEKDKQKIFFEGTFLNELLVEKKHAVVVG